VQPNEKSVNVQTLEKEQYILVDIYESGEIPCQIFPDLVIDHGRIFQ
jgi:hypothetical protein